MSTTCAMMTQAQDTTYTYPNTTSANSIYIAPKFQQVEYNITTGDNVTVNGRQQHDRARRRVAHLYGSTAGRSECDRLDGQRQGSCR